MWVQRLLCVHALLSITTPRLLTRLSADKVSPNTLSLCPSGHIQT